MRYFSSYLLLDLKCKKTVMFLLTLICYLRNDKLLRTELRSS